MHTYNTLADCVLCDWQMNVADSDVVRAVMMGAGYRWVDGPESADVVFLNTCAIRGEQVVVVVVVVRQSPRSALLCEARYSSYP